jgi:prevent-host-death family protein
MKTVGIRELKNNLSAYVRAARKGETVVVTDRGEPVVQLTSAQTLDQDDPFAEMVRRGEMTPGRKLTKEERAKMYARRGPPILKGITSQQILDELREETLWPSSES